MKENFIKVALSICLCLIAFPFLAKGQLPFSPCSPSGGKRADVLGFETKYRAPGGAAPTFTIPTGTKSIAVYVSSETGITTGTSDYDQGDEDFITINAIIDVGNKTSSGYVNYAKNTNTDGSGTNVYGWKNAALGDTIHQANKIGDALPYLNNVKFSISGSTLTIAENATGIHSSYYVEYLSPYNNSLSPLDPQIRALLHGTGAAATDLSIPIPAGAEIVFISGKGTNSSPTDLNTTSGTEEGYANMRFGLDLTAGTLNGFVTLANGGSVTRRSTYVISNKSSTSSSDMVSSGKITGDYTGKLTTDGAVGLYNPTIYVSGSNLIIKRDANYARDFDDAYVVEFYSRVGLGMSTEFIDSDISAILDGSYTWGAKRTFTIPSGTNFIYFNETGNAVNTDRESNENSLAAYGYIDLSAKTVTGYFYQQVGLSGTTRRDDNYSFKNVPLDSTSTRNAAGTVGFKNTGAVYDISFFLSSDKSQLTVINKTGLANPSYQFLLSCDYYGSRPDVAFSTAAGIAFTKGGSCNIVKATVNVCNPGSGNSSGGMPVSFYSGDPTTDPAAILLYSGTFNQDIPQGECRTFSFDLDLSSFSNVNIPLSMILNDNGSFVSGGVGHAVGTPFTLASLANQNSKYKECYYDNNLISAQIAVNNCPVVNLDLDSSSGATKKNFINYFAAGSATGANIADNDVTVSDPDGDNISSARIVLTNDQDGASEYLVLNGTLPAGITITGVNTDTIRLTGVASAADYAAALKLIQYMNTKGTPNTTTRTVTVEVNDGKETGPASTTSIYILTTPRVNVTGNGSSIADNKTTTSTTDGTNYGVLTSTGGMVNGSFIVQNVGTGTITLTGTPVIAISGDAGFSVTTQPSGTSINSGSGLSFVVTFNPASHAIGTYTAVVTIKNNDSNTDRASYSFTVSAVVNNLPTVSDNSVSGAEDNALTFTAANFTGVYTDPDGTALSKIKIVSLPLNGSFKLNGTGITVGQEIIAADLSKIVFTPTVNWNGTTSFQWNGSDGTSYASSPATMTINITPVNDAPAMVLPTGLAVTEDVPASLKDVSFSDVDAGTGSVTATFMAPTGWFNTATVAGVTVTGAGTNNVTLSGALSAINSYISGGNLTYSASHTPPATETITVVISDEGNTGAGGIKTASGTISLGITAVNDAPDGPDTNEEVNQDTPLNSKVTATDLDGDAVTFVKAGNPSHGTVTVNADGTYTYNPATGYVGTDKFTVTVSDGHGGSSVITVNITVKKVNHAPMATDDAATLAEDNAVTVAVLANDVDPDGDALTVSLLTGPVNGMVVVNADGSITYTPGKDYNGLDSLKYSVCDNGTPSMCDTARVMFTVTAVNDAPVAVNDAVTVVEDTPGTGNVLTNDSDVEGDLLTASLVTGTVNGTVVLNADGSFTYTPNKDYNGLDSLKYQVCDNGTPSMCDTGTVIITVTAVNDAPVAVNDAVTIVEDTPGVGNVLTNDTDAEGNTLNASLLEAPVNGTVVLNADGSFTYTPNKDYNGLDSLKYKVCDNGVPGMCDTGTVIFTVTPVNDAPVAMNDAVTVVEDTPGVGNVLTNDTDAEGNTLTATLLEAPVNGTVVLNADGSFTYTPNKDYNGLDSLKYRVCDNGVPGMCDTGTLIITVTAVNDAPVAVNDAVTVVEDTPGVGNVLTNDTDAEGNTLTASLLDAPVNGTVVLNADGSFTYTPNKDYNGQDSLKYKVCDNGVPGMCDTGTVIITVTAVNDAPVAVNDAVTVVEDTPGVGNVLTNDTDAEGNTLTATLLEAPVNGTVVLNADGSFTYTPNKDYNGLDSLKYRVCDNGVPGMCDTGTVIFTVTPVNDAPVAVNDAVTVVEDTPGVGNVLTNDSDVEGNTLTASLLEAPVNGTVVLNADGSFTYTPNNDYNGLDSLKYRVCDNGVPSMCDTGTVIFTVTPVNDAPVAVNDAVTVTEDVPATGNVLTNDTDVEGNTLTASLLDAPVNGTVVLNADGSFTYTPNKDYNGLDSLKYKVCDNGVPGMCDTGTVIFTVTPANDAPVAVNDAVTVTEDVPATGNVLTNDTDVEGNTLTASLLEAPVNGTVVLNADGSFTYTPNKDYNGLDSLKYRVCDNGVPSMCDTGTVIFTVTPVNDAPVAVNDAVTVTEDLPATGNVLTNDTDVEGNTLTASLLEAPVNGTVVLNADGSFTYTPNKDYNGLDSLKYKVCDNGVPSMCDTGTVIITVTAVNDAPVAVNDAVTVTEDIPATGNVLTNDTDVEGNTLTASLLEAPVNGTVVLNADGSFTYTPNKDYNGLDSLKYRVCDNGVPSMCDTGTVIFTVTPVNDAPVAVNDAVTVTEDVSGTGNVLTNDTDAEGNTLTASLLEAPVNGTVVLNADGSFTYTPNKDYNGLDSLKYKVCDNGVPSMCDTGTVIFTVTPVNDAPVAVNDAVTIAEDVPATGNVLTNDTDVEGNTLTASLLEAPVNGTVVLNADGSFTYTPNKDYNGLDSLKYRVCDNGVPGMCDTGTVIFTVTPANDAPVAVNDAITVSEDVPATGNVLTNDTDAEGNTLTTSLLEAPVNGTVVLNADGSFTYTPNKDYNGLDSLKYRVCDNGVPSMCDTGTVIFTVTPVNDAPVAVNDAVTVTEDVPAAGNVLTNDTDVEGNTLTASLLEAPVNGTVVLNADGNFTYTPNKDYNGLDSLKYRVCDNGVPSMCDTGTVIFTVTPVNDAPVAVNDAVTVVEDTPGVGNVLTNDTDVEGNTLTASLLEAPVNGTVVLNADGSFTYTPNKDYNGQDSLKYKVCDNGVPSMCDTGTVIITVTAVNDAPVAVNDAVTVVEDTPGVGNVLTNDTDAEGNTLTASLLEAPVNGTVVLNADGSFTYTPNKDYNGIDSLKYRVCDNGVPGMCDTGTVIFTVTPVNDAPVAVNDAVTVTEDVPATGNVLTNDTDAEGNTLTASLLDAPVNGTVVLNADGSFTYTPNKDYNGLDSLKYRVCDNGVPSMCDTGTVIITVTAVNDAPVAVNDAVTVVEDTPSVGNVLTNDTDAEGNTLTASLLDAPVNGTVVLNADGSFTYTPNKDYNGLDSLKYKVCDNGVPSMCDTGTVIITVTAVNDAPVAVNDAVTVVEDTPGVGNVLTNDTDVEGNTLTASLLEAPVNGTVVLNADGSFTYTPNKDYNGLDSLKYRVCDNGVPGMCDTGTVIITVTAVNDAPVAVNDAVTVVEDTPGVGNVLTNDTDVEGNTLTASLLEAPVNGTVVLNADGSFTYTPNKDYNGQDSLKYKVCDNGVPSMCDTGTVIFTVTPVNDAPVAVNDVVTVTEDVPAAGNVLTNDTDAEGNTLNASLLEAPVNGTVVLNADGSFTYTPNKDYNGLDSLKYKVCDNGVPSMCDTGTVIFTVTPVNDAPVAVNDAVTVTEDVPAAGNVLTNDTDVEGNTLTASLLEAPVNGTVALNADGSFTYTPNKDYNGPDSLKYRVCDNGVPSMCDTGTVIFTVTPVNDAPVAVNDAVTVTEDLPATGNVLTNDTDVEGNTLTASLLEAPVNGTVVLNADGSFTYTPNKDYNGLDSLKYKVCDNGVPSMCDTGTVIITVTAVNDAPVAVNDAVTVTEDIPATGNVLTNDTDVEGNTLTASLLEAPVNGTVVLNADGSFTYTPNKDYNGLDSLKYRVCDNGVPSMCDTGTVIFTVTPVNDAPVAVNDAVTVTEDVSGTGNVLTNDTDAEGNTLTASLLEAPVNGTVVLNADGSFTYTPNKDYNGLDSLKYKVCDNGVPSMCDTGTVIFTVTPVNDAPVAVNDAVTIAEDVPATGNVLTNDTDVEGNTLTASLLEAPVNGTVVLNADGSFTYTSNKDYNGLDSLKYRVCDNGVPGMCDTGTVIFTVTPANDAPVAVNDAITVSEDVPATGNVLTNDTDAEGNTLTTSLLEAPVNGTVVLNADGSFTYTPNKDYNGLDSLKYRVCDNGVPSMCDTGIVIFTVTPVNDTPQIAGGSTTTTEQDKPVKNTLVATDPDGDPLTFDKGSDPTHGSVVVDNDGTYTYTPEPGYTGNDTFTIIVDDGHGDPKTVTVTVTVTPPTTTNTPPVVTGGYDITTEQDKPVKDTLVATDPDSDPLTFDKGSDPSHGSVVVDKDGSYTYTPTPGYTGTDTFTIIVDDGHGDPKTVTVTVVVTPPTTTNNPPVVTGGTTTTTEQDKPVKDTLTATDPEGGPLTYEKGNDPAHGSVVVDNDGSYTYTPEPGYTGNDTFTIIVKDDKGNETTVTVTVTVTTPNKAPVVTGGDITITTGQDKPTSGTITATDPDGDPITFEKSNDPAHGAVVVNDDGTYTYTPAPGYTGDDTFTIIVTDDKGKTTSVTVAVTVTPDNTNNPVAVNDSVTVVANTPLDIDVLANDSARTSTFEPGSVTIVDQPTHGTVVVNSNGTITYTPATGYTGDDTFTYQVNTADGKTTNIATVRISTSFAEITVPTLFTPNGDGRNDVFEIRGLNQYAETELIIVNRWGNEVFRSKNYQNTWKGDGLNEGTYFYLLRIRSTASSGWEVIKGYTTLVRNFNN